MAEWQPIETAPKDGTAIQARIPGNGSDNIIAWTGGLIDSDNRDCGGWQFVEDQEPPDDWSDGICWTVNEDGKSSTQPKVKHSFELLWSGDDDCRQHMSRGTISECIADLSKTEQA